MQVDIKLDFRGQAVCKSIDGYIKIVYNNNTI